MGMNAHVPPGSTGSAASRDDVDSRRAAQKAVRAAMVGNFVEWFDYGVYAYLAPVIATVFFPNEDRTAALLSTYAVFALSFFVRPLGGVYFGRLADRVGRQKVLAVTILIMAAATTAIGVLPPYAVVGLGAPALLVLCRMVQGFAAGGEYAGAVSFVVEFGPTKKRALYGSWVAVSVFLGLLCGSGLVGLLSTVMSADALNSWGWRIPFLIAAPIGAIGLYIRLKLEETPEFKMVLQSGQVDAAPLRDAIRTQRRNMAVFFSFAICNAVASYLFGSYLTTYLVEVAGHSKPEALFTNTIALVVLCFMLPVGGLLTDRYGRKPMLLTASVLFAILAIPIFILAGVGGFGTALAAQLLFVVIFFFISPPVTVSIAEMFPANVRVTAGAISYNLAFTVFGGTAPFVATALIALTGNKLAPAYYAMAIALFSTIVVAVAYRERGGREMELSAEAPAQPATA